MAMLKLQFRPGINRDQTNYGNEGGWYDCDKIRFRSGYPQKIGGWVKYTPTSFSGVCRQMWNWTTSYSDNFLGLGTNNKVYIEVAGTINDVTPLRASNPTLSTPTTDNCVSTTVSTRTVKITLTSHGAVTGSFVTVAGVTGNPGGVPNAQINANHMVTVLDANNFTFTVATAASSTAALTGGTAITVSFEIAPGFAAATLGYGWGTGTWGRDAWGLGSDTPIALPQQDWWLDNFNNDFVLNIRDGAPYWWRRGTVTDPGSALATRAVTIQSLATANSFDPDAVPARVTQLLVSQTDKHVLAFGAVPYGSTSVADFDPLLIRWADQDSPYNWTPTVTNSAGDLRISRGSRVVRALPTRQEILVWTDASINSLQFLGTADVFGLQELSSNISIVSPRAAVYASDVVYWMGKDKFYSYSGRVQTLPCTVLTYVFEDINLFQADQVVSGSNEKWNEVWWFYPSANSNWNNRYVIYNYFENQWYFGNLSRTAWLDSALREFPMAAVTLEGAEQGYLYSHENGVDDDTLAMESFITSSDYDLSDGNQFVLTRRIIPDLDFSGSTAAEPAVTFTLYPRDFPGDAVYEDPADSQRVVQTVVPRYTGQVFVRARARQLALKVSSSDIGVQWQLGTPRIDGRLDGRQ
jgi:hypothetical protein